MTTDPVATSISAPVAVSCHSESDATSSLSCLRCKSRYSLGTALNNRDPGFAQPSRHIVAQAEHAAAGKFIALDRALNEHALLGEQRYGARNLF